MTLLIQLLPKKVLLTATLTGFGNGFAEIGTSDGGGLKSDMTSDMFLVKVKTDLKQRKVSAGHLFSLANIYSLQDYLLCMWKVLRLGVKFVYLPLFRNNCWSSVALIGLSKCRNLNGRTTIDNNFINDNIKPFWAQKF